MRLWLIGSPKKTVTPFNLIDFSLGNPISNFFTFFWHPSALDNHFTDLANFPLVYNLFMFFPLIIWLSVRKQNYFVSDGILVTNSWFFFCSPIQSRAEETWTHDYSHSSEIGFTSFPHIFEFTASAKTELACVKMFEVGFFFWKCRKSLSSLAPLVTKIRMRPKKRL